MKKTGTAFEQDVKSIYELITAFEGHTTVTHNELITGPDGERQFDVVLRTKVASEEYLTVIECKDYARAVNVTAVDALNSKMTDINANKGILISRKGFSRTAKQKAKRLGISLGRIDSLSNDLSNPWHSLPVVFKNVLPEAISLGITHDDMIDDLTSIKFRTNDYVSGLSLAQLVELAGFGSLLKSDTIEIEITEKLIGGPVWLTNGEGKQCKMRKVALRLNMPNEVYFGYASMLPSATIKSNENGLDTDLFVDVADFDDVAESFEQFRSFEQIPSHLKQNHLAGISMPSELNFGSIQMRGKRRDTGEWDILR